MGTDRGGSASAIPRRAGGDRQLQQPTAAWVGAEAAAHSATRTRGCERAFSLVLPSPAARPGGGRLCLFGDAPWRAGARQRRRCGPPGGSCRSPSRRAASCGCSSPSRPRRRPRSPCVAARVPRSAVGGSLARCPGMKISSTRHRGRRSVKRQLTPRRRLRKAEQQLTRRRHLRRSVS